MSPDEQGLFERYGFNPFQFTPSDDLLLDFHRRQVSYFFGCTRVLDLGAGRGFFLRQLKANGISGIGVENHDDSIAIGKASGVEYSVSDIFTFFQSSEGRSVAVTCDGVYCAHVLEHFDPEQVFELFRLVKTYCAANVRCRFITNNPADIDVLGGVFLMDLTHKRLYPPSLLVAMANSQGFEKATASVFLGMRLGKWDMLRRVWERPFWGRHKWLPNLRLDCS
jgi:SAM-dependent methyltransferase